MRKQLLQALAARGLAPDDQQAIRLAYGHCQPFDVVARAQGVLVGTVKVRIRRARRLLRDGHKMPGSD